MLGRSAAEMMIAKKSSPRTSRNFHSARAITTIEPATSVTTAARRVASFTRLHFPRMRTAQRPKTPYERTFARHNGPPDGRRRARSPRRPGAQPEGHHRPAPAERSHLHHGALRLREVEPCLRHDLRRGPASVRRVALGVRAPVPADDGEA